MGGFRNGARRVGRVKRTHNSAKACALHKAVGWGEMGLGVGGLVCLLEKCSVLARRIGFALPRCLWRHAWLLSQAPASSTSGLARTSWLTG